MKKDDKNAIIIVLVLIGLLAIFFIPALYALGYFNPATYGQRTNKQQSCSGFQYLVYVDHVISNSELTLRLRNGNSTISISGISVHGKTDDNPSIQGNSVNGKIKPYEEFTIKADSLGLSDSLNNKLIQVHFYIEGKDWEITDIISCTGPFQ